MKIGIWGNSLGGAFAIQALEIDKRIEFGVVQSTFAELHVIVHDYKKRMLNGVGAKWMSNYALRRAGKIADFKPAEVMPIESVKHIEQAVFMAHGDADEHISVEYGKALFRNLNSEDKELEIVEGAHHNNVFQIGGQVYKEKVFRFIERQLE